VYVGGLLEDLYLVLLEFGVFLFPVGVLLLLMLSAFFSASETALTASSRARIHRMMETGSERAANTIRMMEKSQYLVISILLGNNLVNILATSLMTVMFVEFYGDIGVAVATIVMTLLILLFSETLPKTYAILHPEETALRISPLLRFFHFILSPLVFILSKIVQVLLTLLVREGGRSSNGSKVAAKDELRGVISLQHSKGMVVKDAHDMLIGALDLNDREVSEVMVHRKDIFMIDMNIRPSEIIDACTRSPYTRVPLYDGNKENIVAVLHVKDILCAADRMIRGPGGSRDAIHSMNIMDIAMEPTFVPETTSLSHQLASFLKKRTHFSMVVDEYGVLQGLITLEDILEEIVGEIVDEHDINYGGIIKEKDGSYLIDANMHVRDLRRHLGWNIPEDNSTTIAGFIMHESECIPEEGQIFVFHGFRFEISERKFHQIVKVKIRPEVRPVVT